MIPRINRFTLELRKIIYTTNATEILNRIRRETAPHAVFLSALLRTEEAATGLIYLAIRNSEKGGRNVREWFAARKQFAIMFDERFNA
jgi:transposase-like protein